MNAGTPGQAPASLPPGSRRLRWLWHLLLAVVIFGSGAAVGVSVSNVLRQRRAEYNRRHPEQAPQRFAERLADRLDLSSAQAAAVRQIVERHWPAFQQVRAEMHPRLKIVLDGIRRDMAATLTLPQLARWDQYVADLTRSWQSSTRPTPAGS